MSAGRGVTKREIEQYLRRDPGLNLFRLADLDPRWSRMVRWIPLMKGRRIASLALLYGDDPKLAVLFADGDGRSIALRHLAALRDRLPSRVLVDASLGMRRVLTPRFRIEERGEGQHLRMVLARRGVIRAMDTSRVVRLGRRDLGGLRRLYRAAYRGALFSPDHLGNGHFFGIREGGRLVAAGGLLTISTRYGVAALGDIATHPAFRRRGYASLIVARICQDVDRRIPLIGLCVTARNSGAIACYRRLGFRTAARTDIFYAIAHR